MPLQRGFDLPTTSVVPGDVPVVYSNGVGRFHNKAMVKGPGVVTGRSGTIGRVHYVGVDYWPHNTALWVTDFNRCVPRFTYYYLQETDLARFAGGSGVPTLNRNDAQSFEISVPESAAEQRAIADALTSADELITTLQRLRAKKQAIKQGMMQQLLTGRTRLPGFGGIWDEIQAGEIGYFKGGSGFAVRHQGSTSGELPFYKVSDMNKVGNELFMRRANNYVSRVQQKAMGAVVMPAGAIVFAKVGAAVFLERKRILTGPSCLDNNVAAFILDEAKADTRFVHYALTNFPLASLVATGALPSLNGRQLRSIPLKMPPDLTEQRAIAATLGDIDAEITALGACLTKARDIKTGMMQQLLTGRIRLPVEAAS